MKILSLFDGMACGAIAFTETGLPVDRYVAYEIDKYAVKVASHNFPFIEQRGDVFEADFTEFDGFDWVIGGSPCTYWSIAQKNNRETEASGLGWELFSQYVRALHEAKPKYFLYENNKSMSKEIRASIDKAFGFEAVGINSALVSAQNRQRLYWVGIRQADGTYRKADIEQPEDRGILLRDILDSAIAWQEKNYALTTRCMGAIPEDTLKKHRHTMVAEPVCVAQRGRYAESGEIIQHYEPREDGKTNAITTVQKDNAIAEPVCLRYERTETAKQLRKQYEAGEVKHGFNEYNELHPRPDGKTNTLSTVLKDNQICEPVRIGTIESDCKNADHDSKQYRVYSPDGKSTTVCGQGGGVGAKTGLYAVPLTETKDGKSYAITANYVFMQPYPNDYAAHSIEKSVKPVVTEPYIGQETPSKIYEVRNGLITIKDKQYPIKLADGFYIIRKLTVSECMRLQTVPEWYDFSVISNSQAYKCLGNGWTCEVIMHLIQSAQTENTPTESQSR